jgi:hypothetical protein
VGDGVGDLEHGAPEQQPVEHRAQAVDVGAAIDAIHVPHRLLGSHVGRRAEQRTVDRGPGIPLVADQPEVHHVGLEDPLVGGLDEDVPRLQVPVDQAQSVGGVDRAGHVPEQCQPGFEALLGGGRRQIPALDVLHGDVGLAVELAGFVYVAHVGVLDPRLGPGLAEETLGQVGALVWRMNFRATERSRVRSRAR